jgi:hypothetical protein
MKELLQYQRSYELCEVIHNDAWNQMMGLFDYGVMHPFIIPYNYIFIKTLLSIWLWEYNSHVFPKPLFGNAMIQQTIN